MENTIIYGIYKFSPVPAGALFLTGEDAIGFKCLIESH
jgi:hypothetical protein